MRRRRRILNVINDVLMKVPYPARLAVIMAVLAAPFSLLLVPPKWIIGFLAWSYGCWAAYALVNGVWTWRLIKARPDAKKWVATGKTSKGRRQVAVRVPFVRHYVLVNRT